MIVYRGAKFYPAQVEQAVRGFPELSDEFRLELDTDGATGMDRCTVLVESAGAASPDLADRVRDALRDVLLVGPAVQIVPPGSLERTAFKAQRVVDRRRGEGGRGR